MIDKKTLRKLNDKEFFTTYISSLNVEEEPTEQDNIIRSEYERRLTISARKARIKSIVIRYSLIILMIVILSLAVIGAIHIIEILKGA